MGSLRELTWLLVIVGFVSYSGAATAQVRKPETAPAPTAPVQPVDRGDREGTALIRNPGAGHGTRRPAPDSDAQKNAKSPCEQARTGTKLTEINVRNCIRTAMPSSLQGGAEAVLQTVAQVVVERATLAAWDILAEQLKRWLRCDASSSEPQVFPSACRLIVTVRLQELLAAPDTLLSAFAADLLTKLEAHVIQIAKETASSGRPDGAQVNALLRLILSPDPNATHSLVGGVLREFIHAFVREWKTSGMKDPLAGARDVIEQQLLDELTAAGLAKECPRVQASGGPEAVLRAAEWVLARCLIDAGEGDARERILGCGLADKIALCVDPTLRDEAQRLRSYVSVITRILKDREHSAALRLPFMVARDLIPECSGNAASVKVPACRMLDAFESLFLGIEARDWIKVTSGALELFSVTEASMGIEKNDLRRLMSVMTAISQLAYHSGPDKEAEKARQDVLQSLIKTMVSRTNRVGWVVSLGGSFGLAVAYRANVDDPTTAGIQAPFALPLGFGVQQYRNGQDYGLHLQVSVLDLGQYVAWEGKDLTVKQPNIQDAVSLGVVLGAWFKNRQIPFFAGPHFGVAPFARDHTPSFFMGGMIGAYVPFIDLN